MKRLILSPPRLGPFFVRDHSATGRYCVALAYKRAQLDLALWRNPMGSPRLSKYLQDVPWPLGVVFVRRDFVGSKREMSPNRARQVLTIQND